MRVRRRELCEPVDEMLVPQVHEPGFDVTFATERDEASGDERRVVDRCLSRDLEIPEQPPSGDPRVPVRVPLCNQDGEFEQFSERRSTEVTQRRLGDRQVPAFDRSLEDRPRMARRGDR